LDRIRQVLPAGLEIYLVGGAVRDRLLGVVSHDLDFVLPGDAPRIARRVANALRGAYYLLDGERGTGRVVLNAQMRFPVVLDFSRLRGPDLDSDLRARDFTINAMAIPLEREGELIDPLGGREDLAHRRLRACSAHSFQDDPLRILRAFRLANDFSLEIGADLLHAMQACVPLLPGVSAERRRDELFKILESLSPENSLRHLVNLRAAEASFPGLGGDEHGWMAAIDRCADLSAVIHALTRGAPMEPGGSDLHAPLEQFHDRLPDHLSFQYVSQRTICGLLYFGAVYQGYVGIPEKDQPDTGAVDYPRKHTLVDSAGRRLALSNPEIERWKKADWGAQWIFRQAVHGLVPGPREIYRYYKETGPAGVDGCLLALAALFRREAPEAFWAALKITRDLFAAWWETPDRSVNPPTLLDGSDLQRDFGLTPGPLLGRVLEEIRESQVEGRVEDRSQAEALVRKWVNDRR
jgi:hypothetical protein